MSDSEIERLCAAVVKSAYEAVSEAASELDDINARWGIAPTQHEVDAVMLAILHPERGPSMKPVDLTPDERALLHWLAEEETNQYGECYGAALDSLIAAGLAEVLGADTETQNNFIAKGRGLMYRAVRITDAGRVAIGQPPSEEESC